MKQRFTYLLLLALLPLFSFAQDQQVAERGMDEIIDESFAPISNFFSSLIFFEIAPGVPFIIVLLVLAGIYFTIYFAFANIRHFRTAISTVSGKYDHVDAHSVDPKAAVNIIDGDVVDTISDESKHGEVSHFQALATAVSGTVGNGNIAGVALAIALGGPGATFWMVVCGLLGMSTKFVECTLGVQYRDIGPMYYLSKGLKERGLEQLGKIAAVIFAVCCIGGSFGGGNAAQSNQATIVLKDLLGLTSTSAGFFIGLIIAVLVGIVIIGGIKRIAAVTEKIVPFMALFYMAACVYIILSNFTLLDDAFGQIFSEAFTPRASVGAMIGVLLIGFKRACFSNEAGSGSASIAHSAVKTKYSASEGLVALLEPFIDTVVICTMTALVIVIYNLNGAFEYGGTTGSVMIDGVAYQGSGITSKAFAAFIPYSNVFLTIAVFLFAVSTMISWSYYGLQAWKYLFGRGKTADLVYKLLFCLFIIIGAAANMGSIWNFSDAMIFAMVFPNMIGLFLLAPVVKVQLDRYLRAIGK
jgi:alanine or glycine:cation symporter, AGCS family